MEAGDHRLGNDQTKRLDRTANRCVLPERQVRARLVVVNGVPGHDPVKVHLAEHDHMVEALASDRADQPLDMGILPG
jgi:hypothetical protein